MLAGGSDRDWLRLIWAVNVIQTDFADAARPHLRHPRAAATASPLSPLAVHKWELETLGSLLLTTPKEEAARSGEQMGDFATMADAINLLRAAENYEVGANLKEADVLLEMARIAHRQFGWQRGFATAERLYRYVFIYGQGSCAEYFEGTYGIPLSEFLRVGFYLFAQLHNQPWATPVAIEKLGIGVDLIGRALPLFSRDEPALRDEAHQLIAQAQGAPAGRIAYLPSILRRFPVVRDEATGAYISPLPQLIMFRMTVGLYYDIAPGPQILIAEANSRFEDYVRRLIEAYFPVLRTYPSQSYGTRKAPLQSPDVLISRDGEINVVIECKATKLTYDAQFADDPMSAAKGAFNQLVKGIAQLWRFFSQVRRGLYVGPQVAGGVLGVLLTLDSWMQADRISRGSAIAAARELVAGEADVLEIDKRPIVFCSMQDLADVMIISTVDQLLDTLQNALLQEFNGWDLREIRRRAGNENGRSFPFNIEELLPWWGQIPNEGVRQKS